MSEVAYKLYPGVGDTILGRMVFQELLNSGKYQAIKYCLMQAETVAWRSEKFYKLALEWAEECLSLPGVIHDEANQHYENLSWWEIAEREQVFPAWNPLDPNIYNKEPFTPPTNEPYICVLTKLRHVSKAKYESIYRTKYMDLLKDISSKFKIVMFGEQSPGNTYENNLHNKTIFSIYGDIVNAVPKDRLVDQTLIGFHAVDGDNSLSKLHYDCQMLANSVLTLSFGCGGGLVLAATTAPRSVLYSIQDFNPRLHKILDTMYQKTNRPVKWFTGPFEQFIDETKAVVNNLQPSWAAH